MPLTEIQAKASKPRDRAYKLSDSEGLFLLIQPNGSKLWRMKYRYGGKEKLLSFGSYTRVGIAAAREKRAAAKAILSSGLHPARNQPETEADEGRTFLAVATLWQDNRKAAAAREAQTRWKGVLCLGCISEWIRSLLQQACDEDDLKAGLSASVTASQKRPIVIKSTIAAPQIFSRAQLRSARGHGPAAVRARLRYRRFRHIACRCSRCPRGALRTSNPSPSP